MKEEMSLGKVVRGLYRQLVCWSPMDFTSANVFKEPMAIHSRAVVPCPSVSAISVVGVKGTPVYSLHCPQRRKISAFFSLFPSPFLTSARSSLS